jgi:hypothetical protein
MLGLVFMRPRLLRQSSNSSLETAAAAAAGRWAGTQAGSRPLKASKFGQTLIASVAEVLVQLSGHAGATVIASQQLKIPVGPVGNVGSKRPPPVHPTPKPTRPPRSGLPPYTGQPCALCPETIHPFSHT